MENQAFEVLEEKINHILAVVDRLKSENNDLRQKNQELQSLMNEKDNTIQTLQVEVERYRKTQTAVDSYKENQDHIRTKVESLINKLKEFEDI